MSRETRVTFYQVRSDSQKRERIVRLVHESFENQQPLTIFLPHQKALDYVDLLLWRHPMESFLPHGIDEENALINLTIDKKLANRARSVLNLCPEPVDLSKEPLLKVFELEDLASTHKNTSAHERYRAYKEAGCTIITL